MTPNAEINIPIKYWLEASPFCTLVFTNDPGTEILSSNQKLWNLFECGTEEEFMEFCGGSFEKLVAAEDMPGLRMVIRHTKLSGLSREHSLSFRVRTKSGTLIQVEDKGGLVKLDDGRIVNVDMLAPINQENLFVAANTDNVTGMLNKEQFYVCANELLRKAEGESLHTQYAITYCNIRNFRYYNVKHGKTEGDKVLRELCEMIHSVSGTDLNARFSSDHFVALVRKDVVEERVCRVHEAFSEKYGDVGMSLKVGVFEIEHEGEDVAKICDLAKVACDKIRDSYDYIRFYDEQIGKNVDMEAYIIQNFDKAVHERNIHVYYQPVIRTINDSLCSMEALARWIDPERGLISPGDFIPILEDNQLITKLDLYVLEEICRDMRAKNDKGDITVPVSLNLSRLDFLMCDIFEEVEKVVHKYGLARDMIHLEITESMVMKDPTVLKRDMKRFRDAGYEIWMDDFGSGFSSLNALREFDFDEIKLDMQFLRSFDEKTRRLIRSIVSMAKEMQIRTLAEGVETQEQYDFLREIGCEKVQGFLFSPPVPPAKLADMYKGKEDKIETRLWHKYYSTVGEINFITDRPLAIIDYDGDEFKILYANAAYREVWDSIELEGVDQVLYNVNTKSVHRYHLYREFLSSMRFVGDTQQMEYFINNHYVRLRAKLLYQERGHYILAAELVNLTRDDEVTAKKDKMDYIFRIMYAMYDSVYLIDIINKKTDVMMPGANYGRIQEANEKLGRFMNSEVLGDLLIHRDDRAEYVKFMDTTSFKEQLKGQDKNYITKMFRTKAVNGAYIWKLHTLLLIPGTDLIIYSTRYVPLLYEQLSKKAEKIDLMSSDKGLEQDIWKTMKASANVNVFWKDTNRRFVGANDKFLDTFGFTSESEIIGKTDEDMRWHIDNSSFYEDEMKVLKKGESVISDKIKCIIRGAVRNIVTAKEPIYHNGKLVGLLGTFVDVDEFTEHLGLTRLSDNTDEITGLMSARGVSNLALEYCEAWEFRKEKFAIITVIFEVYKRAEQTYGSKVAKDILQELSKIFTAEEFKSVATGRVFGSSYVLFAKYNDRSEIRDLERTLAAYCDNIHELAGYNVTLHPMIKTYCSEDSENIRDMIKLASGGFQLGFDMPKIPVK